MKVRVTMRTGAAAARAVAPPEGVRVRFEGGEAVAEVEASTCEAALAAADAWLAAVRAAPRSRS